MSIMAWCILVLMAPLSKDGDGGDEQDFVEDGIGEGAEAGLELSRFLFGLDGCLFFFFFFFFFEGSTTVPV